MDKEITRRTFCSMLLALPFPARAQQAGKIFRIGFLDSSTASGMAVLVDAFRQELRKLGWIEGTRSEFSHFSIWLCCVPATSFLSVVVQIRNGDP